MSQRREPIMDELPELHSDADVDALMARLRARVAPPQAAAVPAEPSTRQAASDDAVRDLVAAQDTFASTVVRAMQVMVRYSRIWSLPRSLRDRRRARAGPRHADPRGDTKKWSQEGAMKVAVVTPQMASGERAAPKRCIAGSSARFATPGTTPTKCLSTPTNPASMPCSNLTRVVTPSICAPTTS